MGVLFLTAITVAVLAGVLTPAQALAGYSNNILWLIVIAFMFARAFVKTGLGRRIALLIIRQIGTSSLRLGYSLSLTDLILAPVTASNTARTGAIVFPIAVSLSQGVRIESRSDRITHRRVPVVHRVSGEPGDVGAVPDRDGVESAGGGVRQPDCRRANFLVWLAGGKLGAGRCSRFCRSLCDPQARSARDEADAGSAQYARAELERLGPPAGQEKILTRCSSDWRWSGEHSNCTALTPLSPGWLDCAF